MANIGPKPTIQIEPQIVDIVVSPGHDYWVKKGEPAQQHGTARVRYAECVAGRGLRGDRYFEKPVNHTGQVTFMSLEAIDEIRQQFDLPELPVSVFRRNLIVSQISLAELLGRRFQIQGIEFEGAQECTPCLWMDRVVAQGAQAFMKEKFRGGLRAIVLSDGVIRCSPQHQSIS